MRHSYTEIRLESILGIAESRSSKGYVACDRTDECNGPRSLGGLYHTLDPIPLVLKVRIAE